MKTRTPFFTLGMALVFGGTAALAMTAMDSDGDGMLNVEEFLAGYPDLTAAEFEASDMNADGMLDVEEHAAAVTAGILPAG